MIKYIIHINLIFDEMTFIDVLSCSFISYIDKSGEETVEISILIVTLTYLTHNAALELQFLDTQIYLVE